MFERPVNATMAAMLIHLLWQLPSVVNKRYWPCLLLMSPSSSLLVYFMNQHTQDSLRKKAL